MGCEVVAGKMIGGCKVEAGETVGCVGVTVQMD